MFGDVSSTDYHSELISMATPRPTLPPEPPTSPPQARSSFFTSATLKRFMATSAPTPDPDQEGVVWHEPEPCSAVITRKEHPRDPTTLSSLREVLRQKAPLDGSMLLPTSKFLTGSSSNRVVSDSAPISPWAKPAVEVSMQAADGRLSGMPEAVEAAGKILQGFDGNPHVISTSPTPTDSQRNSLTDSQISSSSFVETNIRRGKASSILSSESDSTIDAESQKSSFLTPPPLPPKEGIESFDSPGSLSGSVLGGPRASSPSGITASLTNTLASAMRYMLKSDDDQRPAHLRNHHALLHADTPSIDERPHIRYDWTIGKRLKFSCTVYYARQFDALRRRCGIEDTFLRSLARSANWAAEGGKSRSNFWKTADDQYIIKTLVNAWNVADL